MPKIPDNARVVSLAGTAESARRTGFVARVAQGVKYIIAGVTPATWMSPDQPVAPQAQEAAGRQFDYRTGANLFYTPRGTELTTFEQLRTLADNCDIVRIAIETRKDQLAALPWTIGNIDPEKDAPTHPATELVQTVLAKPDGIHTWQAWLRMIVEEMLVIDAATIYQRKRNNNTHFAFELIDGATIKPLIDADGRSPLPPSPAYQQVLKGLPAVDYTRDELLYLPRNPRVHKFYGYSPVEQILLTVNIALRRAVNQLEYFTKGTLPAAFATLPPNWTPQQIEQFQEYWDSVIEGNQARNRQVRFGPDGSKLTLLREAPLQDTFDEWLARIVCFAFSLPATPFVKNMNRATAQQQQESGLSEGLSPLKMWVKEVVDHLIQVRLGFPQLEFRWQDAPAVDPQAQVNILTAYQRQGNYSVNDVRGKLGEQPIAADWANAYVIITATGATPLEELIAQAQTATANARQPLAQQQHAPNGAQPSAEGQPQDGAEGVAKPEPSPSEAGAGKAKAHLHKGVEAEPIGGDADDEPLTPEGEQLKGLMLTALTMIRDGAQAALTAVGKSSSDDRDGGESGRDDSPAAREAWASAYASRVDLTPFALAFDETRDVLEAISTSGSRHQVMRIVSSDPQALTDLRHRGIDFLDHQDPNAIAWAKERAAELIHKDAEGGLLPDATRHMIRSTVTQALSEHQTDTELAQTLQKAYAFSEKRAELIARTEVRNALEQGAYFGAVRSGMQQKKWLLSNDEGVCPICEANAAQGWIGAQEPFLSGNQAPLAHPRCRCAAAYRRKPKEG